MLQQIISHTPLYVWAILAFLVNRGVAASRDRTTSLRNALIIPVVMAFLALQEITRRFGTDTVPLGAWAAGATAGAMLAWHLGGATIAAVDRAAGTITQRGSWLPLVLMLSIFCTRYILAVACTVQPALQHSDLFAMATSLLLGLLNGVFAGRVLRCMQAWTLAR